MEQDISESAGAPDDPIADDAEDHSHADFDELAIAELDDDEREAVRPTRNARALLTLRDQINAAAPGRSKASDGLIGDLAHQGRESDHNPWVIDGGTGVVTAMDVTNDPRGGCAGARLAEALRTSRDPRIKYIIFDRRIAAAVAKGAAPAWAWRAYTGSNAHQHHVHLSVQPTKALYDSTEPWRIDAAFDATESVAAPDAADSDPFAPVALALAAIAPELAGGDEALLLPRLLALQAASDGLLAAYAAAARAGSERRDPDDPDGVPEVDVEAVAPTFQALKPEYEQLYASCIIPAASKGVVAWHRAQLLKGKARYQEVEARTSVPWWAVGIIHALEASFSFTGHLHNGDSLAHRTVQVPKNRPKVWNPPNDWVSSAVDALSGEGYDSQTDWSLARTLYRWEAYNGFGSRRHGIHTPYLWSFSNHYTKGKYVKDGVWDANAVSKQCGAAAMLKALEVAGDVHL